MRQYIDFKPNSCQLILKIGVALNRVCLVCYGI